MTCIVGLIEKETGTIFMGGDSAATTAVGLQTTLTLPKVFHLGAEQLLLGCTGPLRMLQLLQYSLSAPRYEGEGMSVEAYLIQLIESVRECFKQAGFTSQDEDKREGGGNFLVGIAGRLFEIQEDYSFVESATAYEAIGSAKVRSRVPLLFADFCAGITPKGSVQPSVVFVIYVACKGWGSIMWNTKCLYHTSNLQLRKEGGDR